MNTINTKGKTKMKKTIRSLFTAALALAAIFTAGSAWAVDAPTPVAVWTDFNNPTSGDFTWTIGDTCTINADGSVTIGNSNGLTLTVPTSCTEMYTNRKLTVILDADVPNFEAEKTLIDATVSGSNKISINSAGSMMYQRWNSVNDWGNVELSLQGRHVIAYTYQGATNIGTTTYVDGEQKMINTGLQGSSGNITKIGIGNYNTNGGNIATGMCVYRVAIFDKKLTQDEVAAYVFPGSPVVAFSNIDCDQTGVASGDYNPSSLTIPTSCGLPEGTELKIKSITFAQETNKAWNYSADYITLNGVQSDIRNGNSQSLAAWSIGNRLEYKFSNEVVVKVGTKYTMTAIKGAATTPKNPLRLRLFKTTAAEYGYILLDNSMNAYRPAYQIVAEVVDLPPTPTKATATLSASTFTSGYWEEIDWDNDIKPDANIPAEITIEGDDVVRISHNDEIVAKSITFIRGSGSGDVYFNLSGYYYNGGKITSQVPLTISGDANVEVDAGANALGYSCVMFFGDACSPTLSTTGELTISGNKLKAQTATAPSNIIFDSNATLTIDVSSEKTINGIEGAGTLIKTGAQKLTLNKGSNDYAVDGSTVKIDAGNVNIGSATLKDATFIIGQNCTLDNYGWFNILGTFTVNSDYNVTIFNNSGNDNTSKIGGGANFVKGGTGAVTLRSSTNTGDANDFASVTVNGGKLIFDNAKKYPCITRNLEIASGSTVEVATDVSLNVKGTLSGGGTLCGAGEVIFGADATIDVTAGPIAATASTITFGNTLNIAEGEAGQTILTELATEPTLPAVTVDGKTGYLLKYDNGSIKLVKSAATVNGKDYATLEAAIEAAEAAGDTAEITVHVYPGQRTAVAINVNSGKTITLVSDAADPYIFDESFTKTGEGTLILKSGWATMSATINVSEGTLAVADGAWFDWGTKYLSANVTVADGARFDIAYTTTVTTYQTAFSGKGIVCKSGVGSITLDFDNMSNLEGSFELNGGTVIASAGLTLQNGIIVTSATTLEVSEGKTVAASTVTGDGVLTKTGAGALVLDNKPTASITLSAGSIEIPVTDDEIIYGYTANNITVSGGTLYFVNGGKKIAGEGNKLKGTATTWTGNAGNGAWDNEGNWDNGVPKEDQVAMISGAAWGAEITVTADSVAKLLRCDAMGVSIEGVGAKFYSVRCDGGLTLKGNSINSPIIIAEEIDGSGMFAGLTIEGAIEFDDVLSKTTINLSSGATLAGSGELQSLQVNTGSILKPNADGFKITGTWAQDGGSEDKHPIKVDGSLITAEDIEESLTLISLGTDCKGIINDVTFQNFAAGIGVAKSADNKSIVATKVVAEVNGVKYATVEAALNAIADNIETTVTILVSQAGKTITIPANKVVKFANGAGVSGFAGGATIVGVGTVVYDGALPGEEKAYYQNAQNWTGTVWLKNIKDWENWDFEVYGNANSFVKLTGITGYAPNSNDKTVLPEVILADDGNTKALTMTDGYSDYVYTFRKISGTGTITTTKTTVYQTFIFKDVSTFEGKINSINKYRIVLGNAEVKPKFYTESAITFADGVSVKAGLGLESANVVFGKTIAINNVSGEDDIGKVLVSGLTTKPTTLAGLLDASGNEVKGLALGYESTAQAVKIVEAKAQIVDEHGNVKSYDSIEDAINNESTTDNTPTIKIAEGAAALAIENIAANKTFKVDATTKAHFDWTETTGKYLALTTTGLTIKEGAPANQTFTGEGATKKLIAVGLNASDANDKPYLKAVQNESKTTVTFNFFHGTDSAITPTGIGNLPVKYAVEYADSADFLTGKDETTPTTESSVSVALPTDKDKKVRYYRPKFSFE